MSPILYTFLAIALSLIFLAVWAFREDKEGWQVISIVSIVCIGLFGFGMFASINTNIEKVETCKVYEVLKGRHIVVVSTDVKNVIIENYKIEEITDSTKFYWLVGYNHYNYEVERNLIYK